MTDVDKRKHLDFIQLTITRMAANSFLLKAWGITLIAALFALATKGSAKEYTLIAYIPLMTFWSLDAYYLRQERLFRKLYDDVRVRSLSDIDYSLNTSKYSDKVAPWPRVFFSKTLLIFYGPILAVLIAILVYSK